MSDIKLNKIDTRAPSKLNKKKIKKENAKMIAEIQAFQHKLFAEGKRSMLIVLQGMDASGKDGVVRYIFSGMNPLGTKATSFRVPTKEELAHDFLRRIHKQCPEKWAVQVFNRSHYEDILVPTVEKLLDEKSIEKRYNQINEFEEMLQENWTVILKFYLHVSKEKQKEKLNERLTDPTKYWKHNIGDWDTRDSYNEYMNVYEDIFATCDKPERHIIAADQNRYKIYQVAKVILKAFEKMELKWPKLSADQETTLLKAKAELAERKEKKREEKMKVKEEEKKMKEEFEKELKEQVEKKVAKKLEEVKKKDKHEGKIEQKNKVKEIKAKTIPQKISKKKPNTIHKKKETKWKTTTQPQVKKIVQSPKKATIPAKTPLKK